jgi:hypothetical protein
MRQNSFVVYQGQVWKVRGRTYHSQDPDGLWWLLIGPTAPSGHASRYAYLRDDDPGVTPASPEVATVLGPRFQKDTHSNNLGRGLRPPCNCVECDPPGTMSPGATA